MKQKSHSSSTAGDFSVTVSVSSVHVPIGLLSPLVAGFVVVGERAIFISVFFQILIRGKMAHQNHKKSC
jgi:hypothetical protein